MEKKGKERMTSSVVEWALDNDDPVMTEVFQRAQHYLGLLASNMVNTLDPEVVVIGGGLAERMGDRFVKRIRRTAREHFLNQHDVERVQIVPSKLGAYSGALGSCVLARNRLAEAASPKKAPAPAEGEDDVKIKAVK
jgi:glucokinase